ncbi:cupin domain-containing protein [Pseudonocardia sp. H11422]|uniref:cupin domain-containing protein n=1 Tax=Pseudonocardia sp. H11422 TaxID=2835866 RepID=UPI001BDD1920|nr:cupin domain-containing protein [Pseudonocardia sp. H11422]
MSYLDPADAVTVHRAADPPDIAGPSSVRFVAPGSVTAGRYGLFEYRMTPSSPGPGPHVHRTFSESFYVLSGELSIYDGERWGRFGPGDFAHVADSGVHAFRNDADVETAFLILFAPGIARERFFLELAEIRETGRELSEQEWMEFYARHDQVNL